MARQIVGRRKQESLERLRFRSKVVDKFRFFRRVQKIFRSHEFARFQLERDIEHGLAFAHCKWPLVYVAVGDRPENILPAGGTVEKIFTGLQSALRMPTRVNFKRDGAANYAFSFQLSCHAAP